MTTEKHAVVSGLGPNGVGAALELLQQGWRVSLVEKRPHYTRPIHLHLRASYLQDLRRLSPKLFHRILAITTPILENTRLRELPPGPLPGHIQRWFTYFSQIFRRTPEEIQGQQHCPIWSRLKTPPSWHVRLDNAERIFFDHLQECSQEETTRLAIYRGYRLCLEAGEEGFYRVALSPTLGPAEAPDLGQPDLVVLAEGGKSSNVAALGLTNVRFSYPKFFMSAHLEIPLGPRTRRIDTDLQHLLQDPQALPSEISLWASGHGDLSEGTWVVIEVPEGLLSQSPQEAEDYFLRGARRLLSDTHPPEQELELQLRAALSEGTLLSSRRHSEHLPELDASQTRPFAGTFRFEQQCLRFPAAGKNVVVLGDAAGMGHHALSSGLEMGACDLQPLGALAHQLTSGDDPEEAIARYADAVFRSRIKLLGLGMSEYYPNLPEDKESTLYRAAHLCTPGDSP